MNPARLFLAHVFVAFLFVARLLASSCTLSPSKPVAGQLVTVTYDKTGGVLAGSANIRIHHGINSWSPVASPDQQMTKDAVTGLYTCTYTVPEPAYEIEIAFNGVELSTTWDNNGGSDWHFPVLAAPVPEEIPAQALLPNASKAHVMMQGFYWDVPAGGTWYDFLSSKAAGLRNMRDGQGIDRIWFPAPSKGDSGAFSMGYDPYDYYDLGSYYQKGTTACRFGTQAQLRNAISSFKTQGIMVLADIVANHRGGGAAEPNPNTGTSTYTDFSKVASGKATWHYNQFNPSTYAFNDDMWFGGFADVCLALATPDEVGFPRRDLIDWMIWLRDPANAGFDGWRLDLAQGYRPSFVVDLRRATGNAFAVMEKWDTNTKNLEANVSASGGTHTFDFAAYFTLRSICLAPATASLMDLINPDKMYVAKNPAKAVTFCENHDTDKESTQYLQNKMLSYAFILTYEGYPCLFWRDYFDRGLATLGGQSGNGIDPLVWVRGALGGGKPSIELLKSDARDLLVYGTKTGMRTAMGYLAALNISTSSVQSASVTTSNPMLKGKTLHCYAWYSYVEGKNIQPPDVSCDASGAATIQVPPLGYAVYGPLSLDPGAADEAPAIKTQPMTVITSAKTTVTFSVEATGGNLSYQWRLNGAPIPGATSETYVLSQVQSSNNGDYSVVISNSAGSVTSQNGTLTVGVVPVAHASRLINISTRSPVGTDSGVQIAGFVITGSKPRKVLIRAAGPSLATFGLDGVLMDPILTLKNEANVTLLENDDWTPDLAADFTRVGAWGWVAGSKDAALVTTLQPGSYTAIVSGKTRGTGIALVEVFDEEDSGVGSQLVNISTRSPVGTGISQQIAGFIINGPAPMTVVIRVAGPSLAQFGLDGVLADPRIALYTGPGVKFLENDDWDAPLASNFKAVGAWAWDVGTKDAALVTTLQPGSYTVMVSGKDKGTGIALVEVFEQAGS